MKNFIKRFISAVLLILYPCQIFTATLDSYASVPSSAEVTYSNSDGSGVPSSQDPTPTSSSDPLAALQTLGLKNNLNIGPLSVGGTYDTLLGTIFNAHYAQRISNDWAMGLLGEYGANQSRLNGTLGYQLWTDGQVKFTGEYLTQNLPFDFDSGSINQNVNQTAYGVQLQQNFHDPLFQDVNFGGYWSKASNVGLDDVVFVDNGLYYTNERNIAGAVTEGVDVGTDLILTPATGLNMTLFYDNVDYTTDFTEDSSEDTFGAGGSLELTHIITDRLEVSAKSEFRAVYNIYGGALSWSPAATQALGLHFSVFGQHLISHNQTPDSNSFGLEVGLLSDDGGKSPGYTLANAAALGDLESWVRTPAVYMERVLAIAEERTTLNAPTVGSLTPSSGPFVGGNTVTISGSNFLPGVSVTFNDDAATTTLISSSLLSVIVPAMSLPMMSAPGDPAIVTLPVTVVVRNADGQETVFTNSYTYTTEDSPVLGSISPTFGSPSGGTAITLTGTNLSGTTSVTVGGSEATSVTVVNDETVTAVTPAHSSGVVDVSITTPNGSSTLSNAYTYIEPDLNSVSPTSGPAAGGTSVTLSGSDLTGATSVTFGGVAATSVTVVNDETVTAVTPAHSAGVVDVAITTPNGSSTLSSAYTYIEPDLNSISPTSGTSAGGTTVTLSGSDLTGATSVTFGGEAATSVIVVDDETVTAVTPAHSSGVVDVVITTPNGSSTLSNAYTYVVPPPSLTLVTQTSSTIATLSGSNFTGATSVTFGSTSTSFTVINNSTVTATIPGSSTSLAVNVSITTPGGTSTLTNGYTYPRIIFLTSTSYNGNLSGFSGADTKCNSPSDPSKPSTGFARNYTYKALLNGNNATVNGVTYYRTDGTTKIAVATGGNLVGSSSLITAISTAAAGTWTGSGGAATCSTWTSAASSGRRGFSNSSSSTYWDSGNAGCSTLSRLYCVSQ
jgi:hypothetical protein